MIPRNQGVTRAADYLRTLPEASNIARLARQAAERHEQAQWSALAQGVEQVKAREERLAEERRALIERSTSTLRAALDDYNQQQTATPPSSRIDLGLVPDVPRRRLFEAVRLRIDFDQRSRTCHFHITLAAK
ncbi:hypothetical protein [Actinomadura geliboluensis]|uniref:hypothetical protein n=1 Tax=Actinomadura geliboluensis TaxID=882440 RepID=UPI00260C765B|nr:hypothetical protein [Actinomadura geliboluensis]